MKGLKLLFLLQLIVTVAISQSGDLCQGAYYSEKEGADKLSALSKRFKTLKDWQSHADSMKANIRKGLELETFPAKTPLNPKHRNKKVLNGYSVESVVFESLPGFFVTGNLYRPTGTSKNKSLAVILSPHGHGKNSGNYGRFQNDVQSGCASFAKMGALVFAYDMVGYNESVQLPHDYSKVMLFQTWNTIRIIDFMLTLPEADPNRIGITGASGGGTQAFIATALDERIKVSIPVVMVSAHFFGGCACESGMPVHKDGNKVCSNAEVACLAAPRPMLLISDGKDWTKNTPAVEYPFAKSVYKLYGKESNVENVHLENEGHDYGLSKRLGAYAFFAKHLGMDIKKIKDKTGKVDESFVTLLDSKEISYFSKEEMGRLIKGDQVYGAFVDAKK